MKYDSFSWCDIFSAALVLLILVVPSVFIASMIIPHVSAIEINPSVDTQPILCRYSFTKWICDMQKPGPAGTMGEPGLMNQTINLTANMTAGPQGLPGTGINNLTAGLNMSAIVILGDNNGQTNLSIRNASNGQVAYIDSFGNIGLNNSLIMNNGKITGSTSNGGSLVLNATSNGAGNIYINPLSAGGRVYIGNATSSISPGIVIYPFDSYSTQIASINDYNLLIRANKIGFSSHGVYFSGIDDYGNFGINLNVLTSGKPKTKFQVGTVFYVNTTSGNTSVGSYLINTSQFNVADTVRFAKYGTGTMMTDALGNIYILSDEKYKTDIQPFTKGLSKILSINPINYKFTPDSGLDTQNFYTGFSAQQLKTAIPEAVYEKEDVRYEQILKKKASIEELAEGKEDEYEQIEVKTGTTTLSISDRAIIAVQINAIKELNAKIEAQNATIAKQEARIKALEKKVGL